MEQSQLTAQEMALRRIQQRRKQQALRRKHQKRRRLFFLILLFIVLGLAAIFLLFRPKSSDPAPLETFGPVFQLPHGPHFVPQETSYDDVDLTPREEDPPLMLELKALATENPHIKKAVARYDEYPENVLSAILFNPEMTDFVLDYPDKKDKRQRINLRKEASASKVPLLLQWDERWGYETYGSGIIGLTGCGPTCLSMVALYLTGNAEFSPDVIAKWSEEHGYYSNGSGTAWTLMSEGAAHWGLKSTELSLVQKYLVDELDAGHPIICSMGPGDFTSSGHYIVLTAYDAEKGFSVNDPNSLERSAEYWSFQTLEHQISNLWAFSKAS